MEQEGGTRSSCNSVPSTEAILTVTTVHTGALEDVHDSRESGCRAHRGLHQSGNAMQVCVVQSTPATESGALNVDMTGTM